MYCTIQAFPCRMLSKCIWLQYPSSTVDVGTVGVVAQYIRKTPVSDSYNVLQISLTLFFLSSLMDL